MMSQVAQGSSPRPAGADALPLSISSGSTTRWTAEENAALQEVRHRLKDIIGARRQLPDVVGDRRLLRFIRGHHFNIDKVCFMYSKFLAWRDANDVDTIRDEILYLPMASPYDFPLGRKIIGLIPQIIIAADATDKFGNPMTMEKFSFNPEEVISSVSKEDFMR